MKLAVVGATGLVGQEILKVLEERSFPFDELYLIASAKSVGQTMTFKGKTYVIKSIEEGCKLAPDIAIFSALDIICKEQGIKHIIDGRNVVTEVTLPLITQNFSRSFYCQNSHGCRDRSCERLFRMGKL